MRVGILGLQTPDAASIALRLDAAFVFLLIARGHPSAVQACLSLQIAGAGSNLSLDVANWIAPRPTSDAPRSR